MNYYSKIELIYFLILTHRAKKEHAKVIITVLKARGKRALADVIYCCTMTLGGEMSFLRLKNVTNTCKRMRHSQCSGGQLVVAEDFKCVFVVHCVLESKQTSSSARIVE